MARIRTCDPSSTANLNLNLQRARNLLPSPGVYIGSPHTVTVNLAPNPRGRVIQWLALPLS